jgi:hypothetical protein
LSEIRRLVVVLAKGLQPEPGYCRDWTPRHHEVANLHGVSPWLHKALSDHPEADLPTPISKAFESDYRSSLMVWLLREASLRRLLDMFNSHHIPLIFLKGAYLGEVVYQDPALRPMVDVDLLIREEQFESAVELLAGLGYTVESRALYASDIMLQPALPLTRRCRFLDTVDLHRALLSMDYYRFPAAIVWDQAVEVSLWGHRVLFLTPELNFMHLAVHNLNHSGLLRDWLDLAVLLRSVGLNWERFVPLARLLGVVRPMFWVFQELSLTWGLSPPQHVATELASYEPHWLEDKVISGRPRYLWRLYSRLSLLDGWSAKLGYLRSKMVPARDYREAFAGSPGWFPYMRARLGQVRHFLRKG